MLIGEYDAHFFASIPINSEIAPRAIAASLSP